MYIRTSFLTSKNDEFTFYNGIVLTNNFEKHLKIHIWVKIYKKETRLCIVFLNYFLHKEPKY